MKPLVTYVTTDPSEHWYACQPCGENKLSMMVKDMFGMIGIEGKMNHSHRATDASEMFQACVPKKIVQKHTVHCSIKAHARSQEGFGGFG